MNVYTAAQMREYDQRAIAAGIPSMVLMEQAALRVVEFLEHYFAPLKSRSVAIFCGKGNNGGDGLACARLLQQIGAQIYVVLAASPDELKGDAKLQYDILRSINPDISCWQISELSESQKVLLRHCDITLDALLGTGFHGEPRGDGLLRGLELLKSTFATRVAVDIPSGLNADSGIAAKQCVPAAFTITFGGMKKGMLAAQAAKYCGEIWIGSIGADNLRMPRVETGIKTIDADFAARWLSQWTQRSVADDKRAAGKVLLCGGSFGMSGAPILSATAVLRSGAGLCIAALPKSVLPIFASKFIEATTLPLPENENGQLTPDALPVLEKWWNENRGVVAIGPGFSRSEGSLELARKIALNCPLPLVIDADALHALAPIADKLKNRKSPLILTPHGGEMAALLEISNRNLPADRVATARDCAQKYGAIVVYKGHHSVVAAPDKSTFINLTGNPGMASGGSGDVLTGITAAMLAQDRVANPLLSVLLSVYLHGAAGDLAFEKNGNGLTASDIADFIPATVKHVINHSPQEINSRLISLQ